MYDVIIVGAGPAGLNAALILGRCRRRVLLCDSDEPRNHASRELHGFLTRDKSDPADIRRLGREQLGEYPSVELRDVKVEAASCEREGFQVTLADGGVHRSRKILIATGVRDELPAIEGAEALYGIGVFHCPYCDGWERRDKRLAVYGGGSAGYGLALELRGWSADVMLFTDGPHGLSAEQAERLARNGIVVREEKIARFEGDAEGLHGVRFVAGGSVERDALFFCGRPRQASPLAFHLGCKPTEKGSVDTGHYETTRVPGVFVAGDASRNVQLAVVAAAEGAMAAFAINTELLKEDFA